MTTQTEGVCLWCNSPLGEVSSVGRGRYKKYCKRSCRQRAYESRKYEIPNVYRVMREEWVTNCYICGEPLDWDDMQSIALDHEIATVHGGLTNVKNLKPVHRPCNLAKGKVLI